MSVKNLCYEFSDSSKPGHYQIVQELTWDGKDLKLEKQEVHENYPEIASMTFIGIGVSSFMLALALMVFGRKESRDRKL